MKRPGFLSPRAVAADLRENQHAYRMAILASFGGLLFGWDTGLIGGVLSFTSFQRSFNLEGKTKSEYANLSGNIVSTLQAGCFFGALFSFWSMTVLGRKRSMFLAAVIFLIGSIIQTCSGLGSTSLAPLYVGRAIGGFGVGLVSAVVPVFISESSPRAIRGRCTASYQWLNVTGIMLSYWINYGLSKHRSKYDPAQWRISFALQMLPGLLCLIGVFFQHESPRWLVETSVQKPHRIDEARRALAWLHNRPESDTVVESTLEEIRLDYKMRPKLSLREQVRFSCSSGTMFYRALIGVIVMFFQQWTGTNSINYYTPQIFTSLGLSNAGLFATGVYGIVKVAATGLALMLAMEQVGRKRCLIFGAAGQSFCMLWIGSYIAAHGNAPTDGWSYTAIVCVYLYAVFYSVGWGSVPWIVSSEVSPNQIRSLVMAAALMSQWGWNFCIARITPPMLAHIPHGGTFFIFGSFLILMMVWTMFFLPETRGIPLEEMQDLFGGGFRGIVKTSLRDLVHPPPPPTDAAVAEHAQISDGQAASMDPSSGFGTTDSRSTADMKETDQRKEHV